MGSRKGPRRSEGFRTSKVPNRVEVLSDLCGCPLRSLRLNSFYRRPRTKIRRRPAKRPPPKRGLRTSNVLSRVRALRVLLRLLLKLRLALLRAEVIFLPTILRLILRMILVHFHSANRILRHRSPLIMNLSSNLDCQPRSNNFRSGNSCNNPANELSS